MIDRKGYQILPNAYWSSSGWRKEPQVTEDEFLYAKKAGFMFNPVSLSHDEIVNLVIKASAKIEPTQVANGYLASLSSRRLEWRSALGSYAIARHFPKHKFTGSMICSICGEFKQHSKPIDLSRLNFERFKWGGVNHLSPIFIGFDLSRFAEIEVPTPSDDDISIFGKIIQAANRLADEDRPSDLEMSLTSVLKSKKAERRILIQILGYCGILQPDGMKSFLQGFVPYYERKERPVYKIDWRYPISWWQGKHRVNEIALKSYFPDFWERFYAG